MVCIEEKEEITVYLLKLCGMKCAFYRQHRRILDVLVMLFKSLPQYSSIRLCCIYQLVYNRKTAI